jgi:hypothetical protein
MSGDGPEISRKHARNAEYRFRSALDQRTSIIENMNAVDEIGDHLHVVFDPDDRHVQLVPNAEDEARKIFAFLAVQTGGRIIRQPLFMIVSSVCFY